MNDNLEKMKDYSKYEKKFDEFYQAHEKILIYGTGQAASLVSRYFDYRNLKVEFYCVTEEKRREEKRRETSLYKSI